MTSARQATALTATAVASERSGPPGSRSTRTRTIAAAATAHTAYTRTLLEVGCARRPLVVIFWVEVTEVQDYKSFG